VNVVSHFVFQRNETQPSVKTSTSRKLIRDPGVREHSRSGNIFIGWGVKTTPFRDLFSSKIRGKIEHKGRGGECCNWKLQEKVMGNSFPSERG